MSFFLVPLHSETLKNTAPAHNLKLFKITVVNINTMFAHYIIKGKGLSEMTPDGYVNPRPFHIICTQVPKHTIK
jgi:hypothetical protein